MNVFYAPSFLRAYGKLTTDNQKKVDAALQLFLVNPFDPRLRNHKLSGSKRLMHSISAGYDLRILYEKKDGHSIIIVVTVGTRDQVY